MNRALLFLLLLALAASCKNAFFYTNQYTRKGRLATYFEKRYVPIDSLSMVEIRACHNPRTPAVYGTSGGIFFQRDSLRESILNAVGSHFIFDKRLHQSPNVWGRNCNLSRKSISDEFTESPYGERSLNRAIIISIIISSQSSMNIDAGPVVVTAADQGNDVHHLQYDLITVIKGADHLIYMDNRTHWTEVFSERGEQLVYQVPQVVIDSLVTLTLQQYFKRME